MSSELEELLEEEEKPARKMPTHAPCADILTLCRIGFVDNTHMGKATLHSYRPCLLGWEAAQAEDLVNLVELVRALKYGLAQKHLGNNAPAGPHAISAWAGLSRTRHTDG